jgi:hypothetical protein
LFVVTAEYTGVISGQVIVMASIAAGFTALSAGVAAALLCVSVSSDNRRRANRRHQQRRFCWSKVKDLPASRSASASLSLATGDADAAKSLSECQRRCVSGDDEGDETALCRNGSALRLASAVADDDFVLMLESEPLNYTVNKVNVIDFFFQYSGAVGPNR